MVRWAWMGSILLPLLGAVLAWADKPAEEPTVERLLESVPVIASTDEQFQQIRFRMELAFSKDAAVTVDVDWRRDQPLGMLASCDRQRTPGWFIADREGMVFDLGEQCIYIVPKCHGTFHLRVKEGNFGFELGIGSGEDKTEVRLDIPSFWKRLKEEPQLEKDSPSGWKVIGMSPSGKTKQTLYFAEKPPYQLKRFEALMTAEGATGSLRITKIELNQPSVKPWPQFPPYDVFPEGLEVRFPKGNKDETEAYARMVVVKSLKCLFTHMGVENEEARKFPFVQQLDWDKARQLLDHFGPQLRYVVGF